MKCGGDRDNRYLHVWSIFGRVCVAYSFSVDGGKMSEKKLKLDELIENTLDNVMEFYPHRQRATQCVRCTKPFTEKNVHTEAGWRETQLSQMCEDCFDEIVREEDE